MLRNNFESGIIEAGCDEAGRGCLAGPVFAAAVILPTDFSHPLLNDSKKMNENNRMLLRKLIEREAISYAVASIDHERIDKVNILNASIEAMHVAIGKLSILPELLLIDGNRFKKFKSIRHECIVKGDGIFKSIAAASVLAKTYRDEYMLELHKLYPDYGWDRNKAYATALHRRTIALYGESPFHRKSFRLKPIQAKLDLKY